MDALSLLREDHEKILALLVELEQWAAGRSAAVPADASRAGVRASRRGLPAGEGVVQPIARPPRR